MNTDNDETELLPRERRARKGPSKRKTVVTRQTFVDDDDDDDAEHQSTGASDLPLFSAELLGEVAGIRVERKNPSEGFLGILDDVNSSEHDIFKRWGGSTYRISAMDGKGKFAQVRTITVAGDPKFVGIAAQNDWNRMQGLPLVTSVGGVPGPHATAQGAMSTQEMLMFITEREESRRKMEAESTAKARVFELELETRRRQMELEAESNRRKHQEELEERRRRDDAEREDRRNREAREAEARQQQWLHQMLTMADQSSKQALAFATAQKPSGDSSSSLIEAVKLISVIKETFGGGETPQEDILSIVAKNGADWLNAAGNAIGGAIREVKQGGTPTGTDPGNQLLPGLGGLSPKVERLVMAIASKGQDPEAVLNSVVDKLIEQAEGAAPVQPGQAAAPAPGKVTQLRSVAGTLPARRKANDPSRTAVIGVKTAGTVAVRFKPKKSGNAPGNGVTAPGTV